MKMLVETFCLVAYVNLNDNANGVSRCVPDYVYLNVKSFRCDFGEREVSGCCDCVVVMCVPNSFGPEPRGRDSTLWREQW